MFFCCKVVGGNYFQMSGKKEKKKKICSRIKVVLFKCVHIRHTCIFFKTIYNFTEKFVFCKMMNKIMFL